MKLIKTVSTLLLCGFGFCSYAKGAPTPVPSPMPVIDVSAIDKALTLNSMIGDASKGLTVIDEQVRSINNQIQNLRELGNDNFGGVNNNLSNQIDELNNLTANMSGISYTLNSVSSQFNSLFQTPGAQSMTPEQYQSVYQKWSNQLQSASDSAMQSEALVSNIKDNNAQAQNILSTARSQGADGEVSQLQTINEMLGVVNSQLGDVGTMTATAGRLAASAASSHQAQQDEQAAALQQFIADPPDYQNGHRYTSF